MKVTTGAVPFKQTGEPVLVTAALIAVAGCPTTIVAEV